MINSLRPSVLLWILFISLSLWPVHAANAPLEFSLNSDRQIYKIDTPIKLKLEFRNNSKNPLVVYTGLLPDTNFNMDILRIDAKGYENKLSWPRRLYERTAPRKDEFVTIPPYGIFKDSFILQEYMDEHVNLLEKGQYKLTVRYSNDIEGYQEYQPYSFIKIDTWKGKIASNTIIITIQ